MKKVVFIKRLINEAEAWKWKKLIELRDHLFHHGQLLLGRAIANQYLQIVFNLL